MDDLLADCEIMTFPGTDYAFRIFVDKTTWGQVLAELNAEMDYDNFKAKVEGHLGSARAGYSDAIHRVWAVMNRLQR